MYRSKVLAVLCLLSACPTIISQEAFGQPQRKSHNLPHMQFLCISVSGYLEVTQL